MNSTVIVHNRLWPVSFLSCPVKHKNLSSSLLWVTSKANTEIMLLLLSQGCLSGLQKGLSGTARGRWAAQHITDTAAGQHWDDKTDTKQKRTSSTEHEKSAHFQTDTL